MTSSQGSMFVLVNVDKHREVMGDIVRRLVTDYGTPISIVDNIQKICPKCSCSTTTSGAATAACSSSDEQHEEPEIIQNQVGLKRAESPTKEVEPKRIRLEEKSIKEEPVNASEDGDVFNTMLAILRKGNPEQQGPSAGSGASSDDGASNSSNIYEEDEEYRTAPWTSPDFLTSFMTSQPNILGQSGGLEQGKPSGVTMTPSSGKRGVPPMLTVNGKTRRGRIVYTPNELNILEKYYEEDPNACADPIKRESMCKTLDVDYHRLKVWFQNRRRKDKVRSQEEATASQIQSPNRVSRIVADF